MIATILLPYTFPRPPALKLNYPCHKIFFGRIFPNFFGRKIHILGNFFPSMASYNPFVNLQ